MTFFLTLFINIENIIVMRQRIVLRESDLHRMIKESVRDVLNEMGTPKQNALLQKLTGSNEYDNLSTADASKKISELLQQEKSSNKASEKQLAYLKRFQFTNEYDLSQLSKADASKIIGLLMNRQHSQARMYMDRLFTIDLLDIDNIINNKIVLMSYQDYNGLKSKIRDVDGICNDKFVGNMKKLLNVSKQLTVTSLSDKQSYVILSGVEHISNDSITECSYLSTYNYELSEMKMFIFPLSPIEEGQNGLVVFTNFISEEALKDVIKDWMNSSNIHLPHLDAIVQ